MVRTAARGDYVLGTHDSEISRLELQHRVWRARALSAWRRAGFAAGQTILDVGCGPGYAAFDLAAIVGPSGRVVAIDRSRRFLDALVAARRDSSQIEIHELDLDEGDLPAVEAHGAWARWLFAFVRRPRELLARVARHLLPGGAFVAHEYFDYRSWRLAPRLPELEEFVEATMKSWRDAGGEPDIGLQMPGWLEELGFEITTLRTYVDIVRPGELLWQWPGSFVEAGLDRLVTLGRMVPERAREIALAFGSREAAPHARMITPAVLEIIAVRH